MWLAPVVAQGVQHRCHWAADRHGERQRGQRVDSVVPAANTQCIGRHQALDVQYHFLAFFAPDGLIGFKRANQPGHAVDAFQPVVARPPGLVGAESDVAARRLALDRQRHGSHHQRVIAVEQHLPPTIDPGFCLGVGIQTAMPVEVILRDVQHGRHARLKVFNTVKLETRQLKHPHHRQSVGVDPAGQRFKQSRADISSNGHRFARSTDQFSCQRSDRCFAVGAGDTDHLRKVIPLGLQPGQRLGKQAELVAAGNRSRCGCSHHGRYRLRRQARTFQHAVK